LQVSGPGGPCAGEGHIPISILVPCHRFIGADGSRTGFTDGPERRGFLLALDRPAAPLSMPVLIPFEEPVTRHWPTMELLESIEQAEPGLRTLAWKGYHTLGLQTYLTAGPKDAQAWTIDQGDTASQAAGVIHTDVERVHQGRDRALRRPDGRPGRCQRRRLPARCASESVKSSETVMVSLFGSRVLAG